MSALDRAALEQLAENATPGPWREQGWDESEQGYFVLGGGVEGSSAERMVAYTPVTNQYARDDSAFIAAVDPGTVLALIQEIRRETSERERLWDVLAEIADPPTWPMRGAENWRDWAQMIARAALAERSEG